MEDGAPSNPAIELAGVELGDLADMTGYALRRAQIAVFEDFRRTVGKIGLRPAQFSVMIVIHRTPGLKQTEVANALGIQRTNFVAMVNELERLGWVERRALDRRSHALHLTRAGQSKLNEALAIERKQEALYDKILGPGERLKLLDMLRRLQVSLEA
ncbi:MAG: Transcriptional regulator SlyA [Hyphomicrobiales bacterium]|nr:Transcriptional regulator SlyA [Hyphomicrobiales bacterium]